jgi:hypothetical protein
MRLKKEIGQLVVKLLIQNNRHIFLLKYSVDTFTFDGDTLVWDEFPSIVTFECDGGILLFSNGRKLWRLSSDCN